ncbi:MAG: type II toxin-antitoxin system VapC family toxin [Candidatus Melainabacteria bacterium]|nr:type II toxin-antitoxin system VapC family toxin [Candidatus Melainabacteria bacterium]
MSDQFLVTDTHPLIWYLAKHDIKLPKKVFAAFKSAQEGSGTHIWVPAAVAWEISQLMRKTNRISALGSFEELIQENFYFKSMTLTELQLDDLIIAHGLKFNRDPFDALIVATARRLKLPLITADGDITDSKACESFWE